MGILRPVVQALVRAMLDTGHDLSLCGVVGSELVGDHNAWRSSLAPKQLAHQALGCLGIAAALYQNLQDETILIHGTPKPMLLAPDRNNDLIKMPFC